MTQGRVVDVDLLKTYVDDHVTGATAVVNRVQRMARAYSDPDLSSTMSRFVKELTLEREWLLRLMRRHDLRPSPWKRAAARVGERVGRLKLNGRLIRQSPLSPLLELELLAAGLRGKRSAWRTLREWSVELAIDPDELDGLLTAVDNQIADVERLLERVRPGALARED